MVVFSVYDGDTTENENLLDDEDPSDDEDTSESGAPSLNFVSPADGENFDAGSTISVDLTARIYFLSSETESIQFVIPD